MKYIALLVLSLSSFIASAQTITYPSHVQVPIRPNPNLTPGVVDPTATKAVICVDGYTAKKGVRNVSEATKTLIFQHYGVDPKSDKFEIDHLISLELGGSNDIKNLWPQSYTSLPWNAHLKDALEDKLHRMVCTGQITLQQAQHEISTDWIGAYQKYVKAN